MMDISNLIHSKASPADVIMFAPPQEQQTEAGQGVHPGGTAAFPGTLAVSHQRHLLPATISRTCLLLIDIQRGLNISHGFYGTDRSTPRFEENITSLIAAARNYNRN